MEDRIPMVHERRRFIDVMDEEFAVEERRRTMLDKYTAGFVRTQMVTETCSLDMPKISEQSSNQLLAIGDAPAGSGTVPFIREKPQSVAVASGEPLSFTCIASGEPQPTVQWFKDDMILGVTTRCTISNKEDGRSTLTIERPNEFDTGLYKVIARNPSGQSSHKFRVTSGDIPGPCEPPEVNEVSTTECLVRWRPPRDTGNSPIIHYHLQIKPAGETEYVSFRDNIDHEFYLVKDLKPNSIYQFKVAAKNAFGWGQFSVATAAIRTGKQGSKPIELSPAMQFQLELTESGINDKMKKLNAKSSRELDYNKEKEPIKMKTGDTAELQLSKYNFISEMSRGRFSMVAKCVRKDDQRQFAAKILQRQGREEAVKQEFEVLKALRHERISQLFEAYTLGNVTVFMEEQLSGHDILTYLSNLYEYSEQTICTVVLQLIDALQYLHWRGYCHLDLQPDNIVVVSQRNCHIKLVDLGSAREVPPEGATVPVNGLLEYIAPEVLSEQRAYPVSDVWSLGALTYTLLTGRSAFKGDDAEETNENIQYARYRCDYLHCSQEAVRFVMLILKRDLSKRPSLEDCREHRWLLENEFMAKKRDRAMLSGTRLRDYDEKYHRERIANATSSKELLSFGGLNLPKKAKYEQMLYTQIF